MTWPRSTPAGSGWRQRWASGSTIPARSSCSARPARPWTTRSSTSTRTSCVRRSRWPRRASPCTPATPPAILRWAATDGLRAANGPPFVRVGGERRDGTMADLEQFLMLTQMTDVLDTPGRSIVEPNDVPLDVRHLLRALEAIRLTDRVWSGEPSSAAPPTTAWRWRRSSRRSRGDANSPGRCSQRQRQLAAALRRAHAGGPVRLRGRRPAGDRDAVPADGGDGAGHRAGSAGPADGRGAGRAGAGAAGATRARPA